MPYSISMEDRFWSKVEKGPGCWLWRGSHHNTGYGNFGITIAPYQYRCVLAHRFSYELAVGPIPDGLVIDHLCGTRNCVRPDHLEPVTQQENVRRAPNPHLMRDTCPKGHPYDGWNSYGNCRRCLTCHRQHEQRVRGANRDAFNAKRRERYATDPEYRAKRLAYKRKASS